MRHVSERGDIGTALAVLLTIVVTIWALRECPSITRALFGDPRIIVSVCTPPEDGQ